MVQKIPLTRGLFALVDDEDLHLVSPFKWQAGPSGRTHYASRGYTKPDGSHGTLSMHRVILGTPPGGLTDHVNGNGLDNRRCNLRGATYSENAVNRYSEPRPWGYRGVHARKGAWYAEVKFEGQVIRSNSLPTAELAARVYDALAREFQGKFALQNLVADRPMYSPGQGYVIHHHGPHLSRGDCLAVAEYLRAQIANPSRSDESHQWLVGRLAELKSAIAASFSEQQERVA